MKSTLQNKFLPDHANLQDVFDNLGTSCRWADAGRSGLRFVGQEVPNNDVDVVRAMTSNATIGDAIDHAFGAALLRSFEREPDTTLSWTRELPAENFRETELYSLATGDRLELLPRGGTAEEAEYGLSKTTYKIARYAKQIVVDEQDMVDGRSMSAVLFAVEQLGAEARRLRPDLVYSLVLENAAMAYDSTALFHADHSNTGTAAMGTTALSAGVAAIGNQVLTDEEGDPIHTNNSARLVIVPPDLVEVTRRTVRNLNLGDGADLKVLQESRLSAAGLVDPTADVIRTGSTTNWLLAGTSHARPAVAVLGLNGNLKPQITRHTLDQGQWGLAWTIKLDIGVVAIDHRPLYWSTGAA